MLGDITITVTGPDKSGKGYVISAITHALAALGADVLVQCGETHNKKKLDKSEDEIHEKLEGKRVVIMEQRTS
jgi:predicted ATP-binding protein involved in virulence